MMREDEEKKKNMEKGVRDDKRSREEWQKRLERLERRVMIRED